MLISLSTIVASLLASASVVQGLGAAHVHNKCGYKVYLDNVPAAGGGRSTISKTLPPGGSYSQHWTKLSNGDGWSIKTRKNKNGGASHILQLEYTYTGSKVYYDVSAVNGSPFGHHSVSGAGICSNDGALKSCPPAANIKLTLCS